MWGVVVDSSSDVVVVVVAVLVDTGVISHNCMPPPGQVSSDELAQQSPQNAMVHVHVII